MMIRPLLVASAVLLIALPARAERPNDAATLEYLPSRATAALCPAADFLALEVQIRLGYELFQPSAPNHLTVKVDRANGQFRSIGEMRDDDGKVIFARTYSEIDCTQALVSMAISVSVKFTRPPEAPAPSPPAPQPPVEASSPRPPEPEPAELPPEPPPPVAAPLPERRRFQAGLASVFSIGTAPSVLGGVGWFVGVRWPSVSLALEGRALFAPSATIARATIPDGYHFVFAAISGSGCYHPAWAFVCARVEIGNLSFGNKHFDVNPDHMKVLGLGFRFGGDRTLTPWLALRAYGEIWAQANTRAVYNTSESPAIWKQPWLFGSIGVGPIVTFSGI